MNASVSHETAEALLDLTWGLRSLSGDWPSAEIPGHWIACLLLFRIRLRAALEVAEAERLAWLADEIAAEAAGLVLS